MADFPFLNAVTTTSSTLPMFKCYSWDFDNDDFNYDENGNILMAEGNDALKIWIKKALRTERYMYLAYSNNYGSEIKNFLNKVMSVGERKAELRRSVIESLMINPYIKSIESIDITESEHGRKLTINISLTTIYGSLAV